MITGIRWRRLTREQRGPIPARHGDHIAEIDGQPVAFLTRRVDGWWVVWVRRGGEWCNLYASFHCRKARQIATQAAG